MLHKELYMMHSFVGRLPQRECILALHRVGTDLFMDAVVLDAAQAAGRPSLMELVGNQDHLEIWLLPRTVATANVWARKIVVHYQSVVAAPLDLSADEPGVALDRVLLMYPSYDCSDVPVEEWPAELKNRTAFLWNVEKDC